MTYFHGHRQDKNGNWHTFHRKHGKKQAKKVTGWAEIREKQASVKVLGKKGSGQ